MTPGVAEEREAQSRSEDAWGLIRVLSSRRTASVVLLSFSSGMPLGLVWIAIPDWMRSAGVDIRVVGLFTLAQVPWTFNVVWAPLMDRWQLPFLGRRRGWAALAQIALLLGTLSLAGVGHEPEAPWIVFALALAIGLAAASQDIAVDAYAVDALRKEEQGAAVGARIGLYRAGMLLAGSGAISVADRLSWPVVCVGLAALYLPMLAVSRWAPEPRNLPPAPQTIREAVWLPFLGFLSRHRAVEILCFVILFKLADNMASALLRPFLIDMGYSADERGLPLGMVGLAGTVGGAVLGGLATNAMGLGRALWVFGILQIFSNLGYVLLANVPKQSFLLYGAMGFESLCQGLGTGAFSVLLLRMTQKRFSGTQYALFSTLFGFSRIFSGPVAGISVDALGWSNFFLLTMPLGIPGLLMLSRFVRPGEREPVFEVKPPERLAPRTPRQLAAHGAVFGVLGALSAALLLTGLAGLKAMRADGGEPFQFLAELLAIGSPAGPEGWLELVGVVTFGAAMGLFAAAVQAARRGAAAPDASTRA